MVASEASSASSSHPRHRPLRCCVAFLPFLNLLHSIICAATRATIPTAVIFVLVTTASIHRYSSELDAVIIEPRNGMRPQGEVGRILKHRAISCRGIIRRITRRAWSTHISILTRILGTLVDQIPGSITTWVT